MKAIPLRIEGMHCAACVGRVEKVLKRVPGVSAASVNFATGQAIVELQSPVEEAALIAAVEKAGYGARLPRQVTDAREAQRVQAELKKRWVKAGVALAVAVPAVAMMFLPIPHAWMGPLHGVLLVACAGVMAFSGREFFVGAFKSFPQMDMNTLISVGTSAAFIQGLVVFFVDPHGHSYLDSIPVTIGAVLAGQAWEAGARRGTSAAIQALLALAPSEAILLGEGGEKNVPVAQLKPGDRVRVPPNTRVPVDGVIESGQSTLDRSMLNGEPLPEAIGPGLSVTGGTVNGNGALVVQVTAVGEGAVLARLVALVERAQATHPPIAALVDQVAGIFVPVVFGIALLSFSGWWLVGQAGAGVMAALAVLVVACPCALGLATPLSLVLGLGNAARKGVLLRDGAALQGLAEADTVVFDKTGTLTLGRPVLGPCQAEGISESELLRYAAAVERYVPHPLARAILMAAPTDVPEATEIQVFPGEGASAWVEGRRVRVGNPQWLGLHPMEAAGTPIAAVVEGLGQGYWRATDPLRPGAKETVQALQALGMGVWLLSGDTPQEAQRIGQALGITQIKGGVRPEGKIAVIQGLQAQKHRVIMVGDGVNDAPALAAAHVGVAMASGTDVAMEAAAVTLQRSDPQAVVDAIQIARATLKNVRQNLWGAFGYNIIALPLAALGMLHPAIAGTAMALSSVVVVSNALRLRERGA